MDIEGVAISFLAAILIRAAIVFSHRAVFRQGFVGDASIHFAIIRQFRRDSRSRYIDQYLIRYVPMSYPVAFHRACRVLPLEWIRRYPFLPSAILYVLSAAAFASYFQYVERMFRPEGDSGGGNGLAAALVIFFAMPTNWSFVGPGIAYLTLSARYFARVVTGAYFLFLVVGCQFGDWPSLVLAVVSGSIALLSALFSRQCLLFVTPVLALVTVSPWPLAILAMAYGLATLLSPRDFPLGMKHTVTQWRLYPALHKKSALAVAALVNYPQWRILWRERDDLLCFLARLARTEPVQALLLRQPEHLIALGVAWTIAWGAPGGSDVPVLQTFAGSILAAMILYLATNSRRLDHLGESYRYMEYSLYFITPMTIGLAWPYVPLGAAAIAYSGFGLIVVLTPVIAYGLLSNWQWPERDHLKDFIDRIGLPPGAVVFPIGIQTAGDLCARRDDLKSFWYQPGLIAAEIYRDYIEYWPFLKLDPTAILKRHGVTHAIADKIVLSGLQAPCRLPGMRKLAEDDHYIAYEAVAPPDDPGGIGEVIVPNPRGA